MSAEPKPLCIGCLIAALSKHSVELQAWLDAGGDKRLMEFSPLKSWADIVGMIAAAQLAGDVPLHKPH